jgi:hypothetical protein
VAQAASAARFRQPHGAAKGVDSLPICFIRRGLFGERALRKKKRSARSLTVKLLGIKIDWRGVLGGFQTSRVDFLPDFPLDGLSVLRADWNICRINFTADA